MHRILDGAKAEFAGKCGCLTANGFAAASRSLANEPSSASKPVSPPNPNPMRSQQVESQHELPSGVRFCGHAQTLGRCILANQTIIRGETGVRAELASHQLLDLDGDLFHSAHRT